MESKYLVCFTVSPGDLQGEIQSLYLHNLKRLCRPVVEGYDWRGAELGMFGRTILICSRNHHTVLYRITELPETLRDRMAQSFSLDYKS